MEDHSAGHNDDEMPNLLMHSPYMDNDDAVNILKSKNDTFSILSLNCQSLQSKFDQLQVYTKLFNESDCPFSIICLQETWLKDNSDTSLLQLEGYSFVYATSSCSAHGGVAMYIRNSFEYKVLNSIGDRNIWDGLFVEISFSIDNNRKKVVIGNIYRPPRNIAENYTTFNNDMDELLTSMQRTRDIILVGDFNIDLLKLHQKQYVKEFFDTMTANGLLPKITLPTRLTDTNGTLIDNCFVKITDNFSETTSGILYHNISDHQPYFISLDYLKARQTNRNLITYYSNSQEAKLNFKNEIAQTLNSTIFENLLNNDPNENYNLLDDMLQQALDKHMPIKVVKANKYKHKKNSWITQGIMRSIKFRDKLYKKLKSTNPNSETYNVYKINLQTYNRILRQNIRLAKKTFYHSCFEKFKRDVKNTWIMIKNILNEKRNVKKIPKYFHINNVNVSDPTLIANKFNEYFTEIGPTLAESITPPAGKSFIHYLKNHVAPNFKFHAVSEKMVTDTIGNLKPKPSCGVDRVSNKLLKLTSGYLAKPLTMIINQSFETGIFPNRLKLARVLPIYKKNEEFLLENYRPVSVLPSISKVFERIMYNQLYDYFTDQKLFFNSQYGFRSNHSTELAALELLDRIVVKMDQNDIPLNIYLDLSKAFDTLNHEILIYKLKHYGILGNSLKLLVSYLTNRKQYVEFGESKSDYRNISTGVPQGSILGPLFFIIYLNDLINATNMFYPVIYADDTALSTTLNSFNGINDNSEEEINKELNIVNDWFKLNKLSLNPNKTKAMLFSTTNRTVRPICLKIEDSVIDFVEKFNYLGIVLDNHLSWKAHTDMLSQKLAKTIGIMCKLKNFVPRSTLLIIYNSLISSYLNYGLLAWGCKAEKVLKLQKKAIRIISNSKYNAHTDPLFKTLQILKVTDLCELQELKFAFKLENRVLPSYFLNAMYYRHSEIHTYYTRHANNLVVPPSKHYFTNKSIRFRLPGIFNNCPKEIKDKIYTHSYESFVNYIKRYFIDRYELNCSAENCYICRNR